MSTYFLSFGFLLLVIIATIVSCSPIFLDLEDISDLQDDQYDPIYNDSEEEDRRIVVPRILSAFRPERSVNNYPRVHRNAWYRVSTYQNLHQSKPEEITDGYYVLRWGR